MAVGLVDEAEGWNGLDYVKNHVYGIDFMSGSQLINDLTSWNMKAQFKLMSQKTPERGQEEVDQQKKAREIIQ
jgi:hypothetical protein